MLATPPTVKHFLLYWVGEEESLTSVRDCAHAEAQVFCVFQNADENSSCCVSFYALLKKISMIAYLLYTRL